jgi:hypothetical protein
MNIESLRRPGIVSAAVLAAALVASATSFAQGKDDLWEVTMKMEMPGMPMAMPAQVHRVCVAKNHKDEDLIPRRDNCRVLDSNRSGNKLAYKMKCTGDEPMDVSGEMTYGSQSYEGRMRMMTTSGGQAMEMGQTFAGRRVGDCTATK